jgi:PTS system mannose-specific IIB component
MIVLFRIDERLIHGQIAVAWSKSLAVTHIVVANDEVINDEIQKAALKMAVPADVKLAIKGIDEAVSLLKDERLADKRVMVIVKRPQDALRIVRVLPGISTVNLGNYGGMDNNAEAKEVAHHIRLTDADIVCLKEIHGIVPVELQVIPDSTKKSLNSIC